MPGMEHGLQRGFGMVVETLVVAVMFSAMIESGLIPKFYFTLVNVISIIGLVFLIDKSRSWPYGYLAGWVLGIFFSLGTLIQTEFLGAFDLLVYGATVFGTVFLRVKIHT